MIYLHQQFFFLMSRHTPRSTLFPYTTLFRSRRNDRSGRRERQGGEHRAHLGAVDSMNGFLSTRRRRGAKTRRDRKSTRLNSSHRCISYAVFCLKKKKKKKKKEKTRRKKNHTQ